MKIAILILAHKNQSQVQRLIDHLKSDFDIYVHIDSNASIAINAEKNVVLVASLPVYWGSYNLVLATLRLLEKAHENRYDRYILISGQDVPLKPNSSIACFFQNNPDAQFIESEKLPRRSWASHDGGFDRISLYYPNKKPYQTIYTWLEEGFFWAVRKVQKKFPKLKRNLFNNYWGGAEWLNMTGDCVEYILNYLNSNESFLRSFRHTRCADEIFFQTIIMNSPFASKCVQNYLRYVDFDTGPEYPRTIRESEYSKLISSDALFARKFDANVDNRIIEKIYDYVSIPREV
jgi:hypothetical protein